METRTVNSRLMLGGTLVALGVLFLIDQFVDANIVGDYWPLLLIGWGAWTWYLQDWRISVAPLVLIVVGTFLLIGNITNGYDVWQFWPIIIIVIGLAMIARRAVPIPGMAGRPLTTEGVATITDVFSGGERHHSGEFRGGQITAIFGGGSLDLRDATLPASGATIDVTCLFGGYEIKVPESWQVDLRVSAILGGCDDKRRGRPAVGDGPRLTITGTAMFGGFEVKD